MSQKLTWYHWLSLMVKEFLHESATKSHFEVVNIYECEKTGFMKAVIKLSSRHTIERNISEIVVSDDLIEGLDKKTIRTLTYMATVERLKPDYSIIVQEMSGEVNEYLLEIKSKNSQETIKKSSLEISKDNALIEKFNSVDSNRIGYMAGVQETVKEFHFLRSKH